MTGAEGSVHEVVDVRKLAAAAVALLGGLVAYRRLQADRAEQDLWAEATDPVG